MPARRKTVLASCSQRMPLRTYTFELSGIAHLCTMPELHVLHGNSSWSHLSPCPSTDALWTSA